MRRRNLKQAMAIVLAVSMTAGNVGTAFAGGQAGTGIAEETGAMGLQQVVESSEEVESETLDEQSETGGHAAEQEQVPEEQESPKQETQGEDDAEIEEEEEPDQNTEESQIPGADKEEQPDAQVEEDADQEDNAGQEVPEEQDAPEQEAEKQEDSEETEHTGQDSSQETEEENKFEADTEVSDGTDISPELEDEDVDNGMPLETPGDEQKEQLEQLQEEVLKEIEEEVNDFSLANDFSDQMGPWYYQYEDKNTKKLVDLTWDGASQEKRWKSPDTQWVRVFANGMMPGREGSDVVLGWKAPKSGVVQISNGSDAISMEYKKDDRDGVVP